MKVDKRLADWLDEYRSFRRDEGLVPLKTHPLMAATRYAIAMIDFARVRDRRRGNDRNVNFPKVSMI
jgi:hypothetical protein